MPFSLILAIRQVLRIRNVQDSKMVERRTADGPAAEYRIWFLSAEDRVQACLGIFRATSEAISIVCKRKNSLTYPSLP
jgi:hypothetical protein